MLLIERDWLDDWKSSTKGYYQGTLKHTDLDS